MDTGAGVELSELTTADKLGSPAMPAWYTQAEGQWPGTTGGSSEMELTSEGGASTNLTFCDLRSTTF